VDALADGDGDGRGVGAALFDGRVLETAGGLPLIGGALPAGKVPLAGGEDEGTAGDAFRTGAAAREERGLADDRAEAVGEGAWIAAAGRSDWTAAAWWPAPVKAQVVQHGIRPAVNGGRRRASCLTW